MYVNYYHPVTFSTILNGDSLASVYLIALRNQGNVTATQSGRHTWHPHVRLTPGQRRPVLCQRSSVTRKPVPCFPMRNTSPSFHTAAQKALCLGTLAEHRDEAVVCHPLLPFEGHGLSLTFPSDRRSRMDKRIRRNWVQAEPTDEAAMFPGGSRAVESAREKRNRGLDPRKAGILPDGPASGRKLAGLVLFLSTSWETSPMKTRRV